MRQLAGGKTLRPPGRDIDPLRVLVWTCFAALLVAVWFGIVWVVWKLMA